jgi:hypothetical protein
VGVNWAEYAERGKGNPTNNGAFATLDRRAWEIVEFPVDGESRGERSVEISKSELHGGKHPTECVRLHMENCRRPAMLIAIVDDRIQAKQNLGAWRHVGSAAVRYWHCFVTALWLWRRWWRLPTTPSTTCANANIDPLGRAHRRSIWLNCDLDLEQHELHELLGHRRLDWNKIRLGY